ncbi:NAD(P)H-dependent oxidoreductase subunit E [Spirochaetia bacterium 38H-sp]|uniref:NAD(P)H-dependent oxidoreductase subunit E n=1 Tax=Rarispira pelagica TaxID=3141764 RepID=A0ABU9UC16_9SPIR
MRKIRITVCVGTACYVMGGADILALRDDLPQEWDKHLEWEGSPCLNHCREMGTERAPFVLVDGNLLEGATPERLKDKIAHLIAGVSDA